MKSKIIALLLAPALLVASGDASAADHIYVGSMCKQVDGGTNVQTLGDSNTAANRNTTTDVFVSCPVVNIDPTAHSVCIEVQVWDQNTNAGATNNVTCRVSSRTTGSTSLGAVASYASLTPGRKNFFVDGSIGVDAGYALHCQIPDEEASASNIERYAVSDTSCLI